MLSLLTQPIANLNGLEFDPAKHFGYLYVSNTPTTYTDPSGLSEEDIRFWHGAVLIAKSRGIPPALLDWNSSYGTWVKEGPPSIWYGIVYIDSKTILRCKRAGANNAVSSNETTPLGTLVQEAFHKWFQKNKGNIKGAWFWAIVNSQTQYQSDRGEKAEEAMSELVDQIVNELELGHSIPTYDEVIQMDPNSDWYTSITPGHNEPGDKEAKPGKWHGHTDSAKPINEQLYYATIWMLTNLDVNCLPHRRPGTLDGDHPMLAGLNDGNVLLELKKFFQKMYHPSWTQEEINLLLNSTSKPGFKLPWSSQVPK